MSFPLPAQREAGVLKSMGNKSLKELAERFGVQKEYQALKAQAELGKQYQRQLQDSVVRLGLTLDLGAPEPVLRGIASTARAEDLLALKEALEERVNQMLPVLRQLEGPNGKDEAVESGFLI